MIYEIIRIYNNCDKKKLIILIKFVKVIQENDKCEHKGKK